MGAAGGLRRLSGRYVICRLLWVGVVGPSVDARSAAAGAASSRGRPTRAPRPAGRRAGRGRGSRASPGLAARSGPRRRPRRGRRTGSAARTGRSRSSAAAAVAASSPSIAVRRRDALAAGRVPVLGARVGAESRVERARDVAGGVDVRERGAAGRVGEHAVGVEAAAREPFRRRGDADADDDRVAGEPLAAVRARAPRPAVAARVRVERRRGAGPGRPRRDGVRRTSDPTSAPRSVSERQLQRLDDRHLGSGARAVAATSWPMKPAPTIDQAGARGAARPEPPRIGERAQREALSKPVEHRQRRGAAPVAISSSS